MEYRFFSSRRSVFFTRIGLFISLVFFSCWIKAAEKYSSPSFERKFTVDIYPQEGKPLIGDYHNWIIRITDALGKNVTDARLTMSGGMVAHGHGLPSKPQVSRYLGKGEYLIEGVLFNMSGTWTLQFIIDTPRASDRVRFDFDLAF